MDTSLFRLKSPILFEKNHEAAPCERRQCALDQQIKRSRGVTREEVGDVERANED
jgi:hypothetical protein